MELIISEAFQALPTMEKALRYKINALPYIVNGARGECWIKQFSRVEWGQGSHAGFLNRREQLQLEGIWLPILCRDCFKMVLRVKTDIVPPANFARSLEYRHVMSFHTILWSIYCVGGTKT